MLPRSYKSVVHLFFLTFAVGLSGCGGGGSATTQLPPLQSINPAGTSRMLSESGQTSATTMLTEKPIQADVFVDSIGVNTHFNYGAYNSNFPGVERALVALGVRHVRDSVSMYSAQWSHLNALADVGIHAIVGIEENQPMSDVINYQSHVPKAIEAIEGPNEANNFNGWAPKLRAFQHLLYSTVKSTPALANYPVVGPALGLWNGPVDYPILGNISADLDYGNVHDYNGGNFPDNGEISYIMRRVPQESGSKPVIATEAGFCTTSAPQGVPLDVQGDYIPRLFFDQYLNGISRTFQYNFIDDDTGSSHLWMNCGLLRNDLSPKPSYEAVKNMIALLSDRGSAFTTTNLSFTLSDTAKSEHHMLMQKRDGTYILALWLDTSGYDQTGRYWIPVPSRSITVTFSESVRSLRYSRLRTDGSMYSEPISLHGKSGTVLSASAVGFLQISR